MVEVFERQFELAGGYLAGLAENLEENPDADIPEFPENIENIASTEIPTLVHDVDILTRQEEQASGASGGSANPSVSFYDIKNQYEEIVKGMKTIKNINSSKTEKKAAVSAMAVAVESLKENIVEEGKEQKLRKIKIKNATSEIPSVSFYAPLSLNIDAGEVPIHFYVNNAPQVSNLKLQTQGANSGAWIDLADLAHSDSTYEYHGEVSISIDTSGINIGKNSLRIVGATKKGGEIASGSRSVNIIAPRESEQREVADQAANSNALDIPNKQGEDGKRVRALDFVGDKYDNTEVLEEEFAIVGAGEDDDPEKIEEAYLETRKIMANIRNRDTRIESKQKLDEAYKKITAAYERDGGRFGRKDAEVSGGKGKLGIRSFKDQGARNDRIRQHAREVAESNFFVPEKFALRNIRSIYSDQEWGVFWNEYVGEKYKADPRRMIGRGKNWLKEKMQSGVLKVGEKVDRALGVWGEDPNRSEKAYHVKFLIGKTYIAVKNQKKKSKSRTGLILRIASLVVGGIIRQIRTKIINRVVRIVREVKAIRRTAQVVRNAGRIITEQGARVSNYVATSRLGRATGAVGRGLGKVGTGLVETGKVLYKTSSAVYRGTAAGAALISNAVKTTRTLGVGGLRGAGAAAIIIAATGGTAALSAPAAIAIMATAGVASAGVNFVNAQLSLTRAGIKGSTLFRLGGFEFRKSLLRFHQTHNFERSFLTRSESLIQGRLASGARFTRLGMGIRAFNWGMNGVMLGGMAGLLLGGSPAAMLAGALIGGGGAAATRIGLDMATNRIEARLANSKVFGVLTKVPWMSVHGSVMGHQWIHKLAGYGRLNDIEKQLYDFRNPLGMIINLVELGSFTYSNWMVSNFITKGIGAVSTRLLASGGRFARFGTFMNPFANVPASSMGWARFGFNAGGLIGSVVGSFIGAQIALSMGLTPALGAAVLGTAGGFAGAWAGAAAGAAIGSVVPVIGTVAGGIIGAFVGAAIGSGVGTVAGAYIDTKVFKAGQNFLSGLMPTIPNPITALQALWDLLSLYNAKIRSLGDYAQIAVTGINLMISIPVLIAFLAGNNNYDSCRGSSCGNSSSFYEQKNVVFAADRFDVEQGNNALVLNAESIGTFSFSNVNSVKNLSGNRLAFENNKKYWVIENVSSYKYNKTEKSLTGTGKAVAVKVFKQLNNESGSLASTDPAVPLAHKQTDDFTQIQICEALKSLCK